MVALMQYLGGLQFTGKVFETEELAKEYIKYANPYAFKIVPVEYYDKNTKSEATEEKIKKAMQIYIEAFGHEENFKVWVENVNDGEKYIVRSTHRALWLGKAKTFKYQTTIK